ncbi:MAG: EAL domain-containing protein [Glaciimonas sp.]|nr:EAL domain-containing protein [Glaciimonas sp.]
MSKEFDHSGLIDISRLLAALGIDEQHLWLRLNELEFGDADVHRLGVLSARLDDFHHQFSTQHHDFPNAASTTGHSSLAPELLARLWRAHCICSSSSNSERYDKEYVRNRIAIGMAQQHLGLTSEASVAAYRHYLAQLMPLLWEISNHDFTEFETLLSAILKVILFDMGIMSAAYSSVEKLEMADDAGILAKYADSDRSNYQFFFSELNENMLERAVLEHTLHLAIAGNQLLLHYQPLVDLQTGKLVSLEALVRWEHPELGLIAPDRFIPIAEESGLIGAIGEWVLRRACQDMRSWLDEGLADFRVAVNVSPRQFRDAQLADKVEDLLAEMRLDPHMLSLEITEKVLMQDSSSSENILRQLKMLEVDLILDDFGTGYSSLSYLKRFPFDRVKIDRSFISDIEANQDGAAIAKTIISMAHSLGIKVVAEGVENAAQCNFLRRNRCDEMQGFLISHPLPKAEIGVFLRDGFSLPEHAFGDVKQSSRTLMLVDDEPNILTALKRLLRRDGYQILTANSGAEGLALLEDKAVDVIVSDQRMPGMMGVDFLRAAKEKYPDTVRIVLSGYTELKSVTDAINEGAIYKFLTKPWEDNQLRGHIAEAFRRKEVEDENRRLNIEVQTVNQELAAANRQLGMVLKQKQQKIARNEISLDIVREVLEYLPLPIIGLDDQAVVVFVNAASTAFFSRMGLMPGCDLAYALPSLSEAIHDMTEDLASVVEIGGTWFSVTCRSMGAQSQSRGRLITLASCEDIA